MLTDGFVFAKRPALPRWSHFVEFEEFANEAEAVIVKIATVMIFAAFISCPFRCDLCKPIMRALCQVRCFRLIFTAPKFRYLRGSCRLKRGRCHSGAPARGDLSGFLTDQRTQRLAVI